MERFKSKAKIHGVERIEEIPLMDTRNTNVKIGERIKELLDSGIAVSFVVHLNTRSIGIGPTTEGHKKIIDDLKITEEEYKTDCIAGAVMRESGKPDRIVLIVKDPDFYSYDKYDYGKLRVAAQCMLEQGFSDCPLMIQNIQRTHDLRSSLSDLAKGRLKISRKDIERETAEKSASKIKEGWERIIQNGVTIEKYVSREDDNRLVSGYIVTNGRDYIMTGGKLGYMMAHCSTEHGAMYWCKSSEDSSGEIDLWTHIPHGFHDESIHLKPEAFVPVLTKFGISREKIHLKKP